MDGGKVKVRTGIDGSDYALHNDNREAVQSCQSIYYLLKGRKFGYHVQENCDQTVLVSGGLFRHIRIVALTCRRSKTGLQQRHISASSIP